MVLFGALVAGSPVLARPNTPQPSLPPPDASLGTAPEVEYRVGALDMLDINVFGVADLTHEFQVDAGGQIALPLVGSLPASGRTPRELADQIAAKLKEKYMQDPQVTVLVKQSQSQRVTVEGAVMQPGVYPISGRTTLLQAVAMARGVDKQANLKKVVIFRTIKGQRQAAAFDLKAIRNGSAEDPQLYGSDVVVVDSSAAKGLWRDLVGSVPLLTVFRPF
jgi:polysaccharide export outer membrane protein